MTVVDHIKINLRSSIQKMLQKRRLRWLDHVKWMPDGRVKRDPSATGIDIRNWEELTVDLSRWRTQVQEGVSQAERQRLDAAKEREKLDSARPPMRLTLMNSCARNMDANAKCALDLRATADTATDPL